MQPALKADQHPAHPESGEHCHPEAGCFRLVPLFSHLSDEEMQFLATGAQTRHFSKGEVVFQAGQDPGLLFVVARGLVKVTRISASGREQVVRLLGPGDFYGELSLFLPQTLAATGMALQDARVCLLGRSHVRELLHRSPEASFKMLSALALRIMELETLAEQLAVHPVENRVAALLLKLAVARGDVGDVAAPVSHGTGTAVDLPLTQEEMAKLLGTSQETLSRKLHALEDAGLIRLEGRRSVRLLDVNGLAERAEGI